MLMRFDSVALKYKFVIIAAFIILILAGAVIYSTVFHSGKNESRLVNYPSDISCRDCNIVLIVLDPLRADHIHSYGYMRDTTPTIDSLASHGFAFTNDISASSWTLPADMSLLTGVYPSRHKVLNKYTLLSPGSQIISNLKVLAPDIVTFAEFLKKNGYATGGFTGSAAVNREFGYSAGFDTYVDDKDFAGLPYTYPKAIDWIKAHKENKFFVFLQGYDTHGEYVPQGGYDFRFLDFPYKGKLTGSKDEEVQLRESGLAQGKLFLSKDDVRFLNAIYDEKLQRADTELAKFLSEYKKLGLMDKTIFVFTSGHGEELYDHGQIDHGHSLYQELIHVPLIISVPGMSSGVKINSLVSSIDVMPTVLSVLDIAPDDVLKKQMQGVSLIPAMEGGKMNLDAFSETDYRYAVFKRAFITSDGWKIITDLETNINELYNLGSDKKELGDLSSQNPAKDEEVSIKLQRILDSF
ncbi:sulfatase [Patescibacteria group bacterium]|nr:sulfatase [Patescibacteria group bacterium]